MAHELALRADGKTAMAFVGETPWHGLGQNVTKGASIGVWKKEAGLDWDAIEGTPKFDGVEFSDYKALYRSDTKEALSIVGKKYNVVQPGEVLEFFRELTEHAGWHIHTAGALRGGNKVWAMATNDERGSAGKGDEIRSNLLLATSMDGSMRTTVVETAVRVVCANTMSLALGPGQGRSIKVSHRSEFDAATVLTSLKLRADSFKVFMAKAHELAETPASMAQAEELLHDLLGTGASKQIDTSWMGGPGAITGAEDAPTRGFKSIMALFQGEARGAQLKSSKGTAWGLLNAVTEYADHYMGRSADSRIESAWFGRGADMKSTASTLIAEYFEV